MRRIASWWTYDGQSRGRVGLWGVGGLRDYVESSGVKVRSGDGAINSRGRCEMAAVAAASC